MAGQSMRARIRDAQGKQRKAEKAHDELVLLLRGIIWQAGGQIEITNEVYAEMISANQKDSGFMMDTNEAGSIILINKRKIDEGTHIGGGGVDPGTAGSRGSEGGEILPPDGADNGEEGSDPVGGTEGDEPGV